jgi:hypothetical protein
MQFSRFKAEIDTPYICPLYITFNGVLSTIFRRLENMHRNYLRIISSLQAISPSVEILF